MQVQEVILQHVPWPRVSQALKIRTILLYIRRLLGPQPCIRQHMHPEREMGAALRITVRRNYSQSTDSDGTAMAHGTTTAGTHEAF